MSNSPFEPQAQSMMPVFSNPLPPPPQVDPCHPESMADCEECTIVSENRCYAICQRLEEWNDEMKGKIDFQQWFERHEAMRCKRSRMKNSNEHYPGMCKNHGITNGLTKDYQLLTDDEKELVRKSIDFSICSLGEIKDYLQNKPWDMERLLFIFTGPMAIFGINPVMISAVIQIYNYKRIQRIILERLLTGKFKPVDMQLAYIDNFIWLLDKMVYGFNFLNQKRRTKPKAGESKLEVLCREQRVCAYWNYYARVMFQVFVGFGSEKGAFTMPNVMWKDEKSQWNGPWRIAWEHYLFDPKNRKKLEKKGILENYKNQDDIYDGYIFQTMSLWELAFRRMFTNRGNIPVICKAPFLSKEQVMSIPPNGNRHEFNFTQAEMVSPFDYHQMMMKASCQITSGFNASRFGGKPTSSISGYRASTPEGLLNFPTPTTIDIGKLSRWGPPVSFSLPPPPINTSNDDQKYNPTQTSLSVQPERKSNAPSFGGMIPRPLMMSNTQQAVPTTTQTRGGDMDTLENQPIGFVPSTPMATGDNAYTS